MAISGCTDRVTQGKKRLKQAEALVASDPEVLSGEPCLKGTRVPVYLIGALAREHGVGRTRAMYPFLTEEQIELAALYVSEHPRTGRPPHTRLPRAKSTKYGWTRKVRL
jgi:uncharacterized protein (DUF433 family)